MTTAWSCSFGWTPPCLTLSATGTRQTLIALHLANRAGLDESDQLAVFYASLVAWVGCHVDAYEQAKWFGDDLALKADFRAVDLSGPAAQARFMMSHLGQGETVRRRTASGVDFALGGGVRAARETIRNHWLAADNLAERLGLSALVRRSVEQTFERWDGAGVPKGAKGTDILTTTQLVNLADVVEVFHRVGGVDAAIEVARQRSGTQFAPTLVQLFRQEAPRVLGSRNAPPKPLLTCAPFVG